MKLRKGRVLVALWISAVFTVPMARGYELATHALITLKGYEGSKLKLDPNLIRNLDLNALIFDASQSRAPFGEIYYDAGAARKSDLPGSGGKPLFEKLQMPRNEAAFDREIDNLKIPGWLMRGAIREDDYTPSVLWNITAPNPQDDPFGNIDRVLNHFFDPYLNRPLTIGRRPV